MVITIDPLQIDSVEHRRLLNLLLISNKMRLVWKHDIIFHVLEESIQLTNTILLKKLTNRQVSYHVISNEVIGQGKFGKVHVISCTFSLLDNGLVKIESAKPLIVKITHINYIYRTPEKMHDVVTKEYNACKIVTHLQPELPVFVDSSAYLVMNKMPGIELFDLLVEINQIKNPLLWKFRLILTNAILQTFKKQVLDYKIAHLDLKPENIIVDIGDLRLLKDSNFVIPKNIEINIIDYGLSVKFGEYVNKILGTKGYISPEMEKSRIVVKDEKADIFAIGTILKILWGFLDEHKVYSTDNLNPEKIQQVYSFLFSSQEQYFSIDTFTEISQTIKKMINLNAEERFSLRVVIAVFSKITKQLSVHIRNDLEDGAEMFLRKKTIPTSLSDKKLTERIFHEESISSDYTEYGIKDNIIKPLLTNGVFPKVLVCALLLLTAFELLLGLSYPLNYKLSILFFASIIILSIYKNMPLNYNILADSCVKLNFFKTLEKRTSSDFKNSKDELTLEVPN
jgi:serine/threonine protein kinase